MMTRQQLAEFRKKNLEAPKDTNSDNFTKSVVSELNKESTTKKQEPVKKEAPAKPKENKPREEKKPQAKATTGSLKIRPVEKEQKNIRISFAVTPLAKKKLDSIAKEAGYKSNNDFMNDLLEHLEDYLK